MVLVFNCLCYVHSNTFLVKLYFHFKIIKSRWVWTFIDGNISSTLAGWTGLDIIVLCCAMRTNVLHISNDAVLHVCAVLFVSISLCQRQSHNDSRRTLPLLLASLLLRHVVTGLHLAHSNTLCEAQKHCSFAEICQVSFH